MKLIFSLFSSHYDVWFSCDIVGRNKVFLTLRGPGFKPVIFIVEMLENFQEQYAWKWMICLALSQWPIIDFYITVNTGIWKSYMCTALEETNLSNPSSYEHYPTRSWNKAWKKNYFFSQCQYNIQESSDKNKENHYWGNYYLIQY